MTQFRIKGIDYPDDSLEHGLGKGSGRGRPKGSKNGQIMPGAAYMKDYEIVGHKVLELPTARNTGSRQASGTQQNNASTRTNNSRLAAGAQKKNANGRTVGSAQKSTQKSIPVIQGSNGNWRNQGTTKSTSNSRLASGATMRASDGNGRVVAKVTQGKDAVGRLMGSGSSTQKNIPVVQGSNGGWRNQSTAPSTSNERMADGAAMREVGGGGRTIATVEKPEKAAAPERQTTNQPSTSSQRTAAGDLKPANAGNNPAAMTDAGTSRNGIQIQTGNTQPSNPSAAAQPVNPQADARVQEVVAKDVRQETPEQKSLWDSVGGWLGNAGKDIVDTAVGAMNSAGKAIGDAANWVGEKLGLNGGSESANDSGNQGSWAQTAVSDVLGWVGARAQEFNDWWNGKDVEVNDNGHWRQGHQTGVGERIGQLLSDAGNGVADAVLGRYQQTGTDRRGNPIYGNQRQGGLLSDAANGLNEWWNGKDVEVNDNGRWRQGHQAGVGEQLGNMFGNAGNAVADAVLGRYDQIGTDRRGNPIYGDQRRGGLVNDAADALLGKYQRWGTDENGNPIYGDQRQGALAGQMDEWWNGTPITIRRPGPNGNTIVENAREGGVRQGIEGLLNSARGAAEDAVGGVRRFVNGVQPGTPEAAPYYDMETGQMVYPVMPSLGERISNGVNTAGQWLNDNIIAPTGNAVQGAGNFVRDTWNDAVDMANNVGQAIGNTASNVWNGAVDTARNAWNGAVDTARNIGQAVGNAASEAGDVISATPGAAAGLSRAILSGVPIETANRLTSNYVNGQITREQYEEAIDRLINEGGPWAP